VERLDSSLFDFLSWRCGEPVTVCGFHLREGAREAIRVLRSHIIGWCPGEETPCRPRPGWHAVMFDTGGWCHITKREFELLEKGGEG
jgi:hypothetical protein